MKLDPSRPFNLPHNSSLGSLSVPPGVAPIPAQTLADKRILVTGAGVGLGWGVATEAARRGAAVSLIYWRPEGELSAQASEWADYERTKAEETARMIIGAGGRAVAIGADLVRGQDREKVLRESIGTLGGLDGIVNNAGVTYVEELTSHSPDRLLSLTDINVRAAFDLTMRALPELQRNKGTVVFISSGHATFAAPGNHLYAATKGALDSLVRSLAVQLSKFQVQVFGLTPCWVPGDKHFKEMDEQLKPIVELAKDLPFGRVTSMADFGRLICHFLTGDLWPLIGVVNASGGRDLLFPVTGSAVAPCIRDDNPYF